MDDVSSALLKINESLFKLAKSTLISFIDYLNDKKIELHTTHHILLAYCYKAIDLFEGIIKLQQLELMENAQILIRVLFETNLNVGCLIKLASEDMDNAARAVMESLMIMKGKDALQQKVDNPEFYEHVNIIQSTYTKNELNEIRKYGFTRCHIHQRAKNDNKEEWYNVMFKNFSRNVHALDVQEYFIKLSLKEYDESYEESYMLRNQEALKHSQKCFYQIFVFCNKEFEWKKDSELNEIYENFKRLSN